jgi:hypothetical protein
MAELPRPGVEIIQEFQSAAPTVLIPTLVPFVTGPAKEIIEVTKTDGTLNPQAKQGVYDQLPRVINQTAFPSPRGNINEVDVEEDSIRTFLLAGGALSELERDPGSAFLVAQNRATEPGVRTLPFDPSAGLALHNKILVLALDVTARLNTTEDVVITFVSPTAGNLTLAEIVEQINDAIGDEVAKEIVVGAVSRVAITSKRFGAAASVTVRPGGSANTLLGFPAAQEVRVEGSGFRPQEQNNNTTLSPWIEWSKGFYGLDGVIQSSLPAYSDAIGSPTMTAGYGFTFSGDTFSNAYVDPSLTFTGIGSLDLKVGDEFFADGLKPNSASIMKVESTRFKLGTVNTKLSTFDSNGKVVTAVYDSSQVNTLLAAVPFAPRYAWFQAHGLKATGDAADAALPAIATGTTVGADAESATVTAPGALAGSTPFALAGLNLRFDVTDDGEEMDTQTFVFTGGPFTALADVVNAVNAGSLVGVFAHTNLAGNRIAFSTTKTGAKQALTLRDNSTGLVALGFLAATAYSDTGKDVEFVDISPALTTSAVSLANVPTKTLVIKMSANADTLSVTYPTTRTHTFGAGPFANAAAVCADINADGAFTAVDGTTGMGLIAEPSGTNVVIRGTTVGGATKGLQFDAGTSTVDNPTAGMTFAVTEDTGESGLNGLTLKFKLNDRPRLYQVVLTSNSLNDAVAAINEAVGFPVATIGGTLDNQLVLTSPLKGRSSTVEIVVDPWTTGAAPVSRRAAAAFGFGVTGQTATGAARPLPDFSLDVSGNIVLGGEILRSQLTGQPFNPGNADIYVQYKALRKDVSPLAAHAALLRISDVTTLDTVLGPIISSNPLGLGMFFCMINSPGNQVTGLGVDEATPAAPEGTLLAYTRVANFIEKEEVYALAPLTHDETVAQMFKAHVEFMAGPEQKGERILFFNPLVPDRAVNDVVGSGLSGGTTATPDEFITDINTTAGLVNRGLDPTDLSIDDNVFLEIVVAGEVRNYSISAVNGVNLTLRSTFSTGENADAFFSTTPLNEALVNEDWEVAVRGAKLLIPGSTLPDKNLIADTVAAKAGAYKQRRLYYTFPDQVKATIGGLEELLPAYYACAAIAGLVGAQPPQQGFTNFPMAGFTGVVGSNDTFSNKQLNTMAGGGVYSLIQDVQGAPITSRHQLSTDITSIERRELSITKVVDFTAKFLRTGLRNFIGTFNITTPFLDTLSTVIQGMLGFLIENGVLISAELNNLIQSEDQPDTVLVDVTLDVPFPCNYIRLTLVI